MRFQGGELAEDPAAARRAHMQVRRSAAPSAAVLFCTDLDADYSIVRGDALRDSQYVIRYPQTTEGQRILLNSAIYRRRRISLRAAFAPFANGAITAVCGARRSEERRVGKECRSRW